MSKKKTMLVVDDDPNITELIRINMEKNGFRVIKAETGECAIRQLDECNIDIVLLDLILPVIDGLDVLKKIRMSRTHSKLPVIIISAKSEEIDKVIALEIGADDYITKPFGTYELFARVKAVLRRTDERNQRTEEILKLGDIELNSIRRTVSKKGVQIDMAMKEYELLRLLMKNPGVVYTRDELLETIWDYDYMGETRTVDVHIRQLRKKIEDDDAKPYYIKTVRGTGYKIIDIE